MKKHYFLVLAAGCLSCLSVNAQNRVVNGPKDVFHPGAEGISAAWTAPQVLTRAAGEMLPDSIVWVNPSNGQKYRKMVYTYTENGSVEKADGFNWNSDLSDWEYHDNVTYTYTSEGLQSSYVFTNVEGFLYESKNEHDLEKKTGTYSTKIFMDGNLTSEVKGDMTFNDRWTLLTQTTYGTLDINEDGKIDEKDNNADGSPWHKIEDTFLEYDASNRKTKETHKSYWNDRVLEETEMTWVWDGKSYTYVTKYIENGEVETFERKYDVTDGNPKKGLLFEKNEAGEWLLIDEEYTYYPKGIETANETVEAPARDVKISVVDGTILISTQESLPVQVYSVLGACHYNATVNGDASVSGLPAGIYVVRVDGNALKVLLK